MSVHIHILSSSPNLKRFLPKIRTVTNATIKQIQKFLPLKNIDVLLYENPDDTVDEVGGIGGYTPNANTVLISLNPKHPKFKDALADELPATLTHEIHHAIRWRKPGYGETLLEALITEGLADHFSIETKSIRNPPPWARALKPAEQTRLLKRAKHLFHKPYNHSEWFFGSKINNIPRWTGYSLGFYLVNEYLKAHPQATASSLVSTNASKIVT